MNDRDLSDSKPLIYVAAPLFSEAERGFNAHLKVVLEPHFSVYLPQDDGGLLVDMVSEGMNPKVAARRVFEMDISALDRCDLVLIVLDGRVVDEGAAFELGFAYARGKRSVGLKTDPRQLLAIGNNPMIDGALERVFPDIRSFIQWVTIAGGSELAAEQMVAVEMGGC